MGGRLAYPKVSPERIHEIYKQSQREPVHAYGFFVDLGDLYDRKRGVPDPNQPDSVLMKDMGQAMWEVHSDLLAAGLDVLSITYIPTPKRYRKPTSPSDGWLVMLATGFKKVPHVPVSEEFTERVQAILKIEEQPTWWSLGRGFSYPSPKSWIKHAM